MAEQDTAEKNKKRERKCVASGEILPENQLVRFVVGPGAVLVPDVATKLPGRGVWVRASRADIETATKKGGFARSLKENVRAPEDLADQTEALLSRRLLEQLGLIRRAGMLALGAELVESAVRARPAPLLIEACDGAEDGRNKILGLHIGLWRAPAPLAGCFSASELGMALGRPRVIHACVLQERMALHWAADLGRLAGFRVIVPSSWPDSWRGLGRSGAGA